MKIKIIFFGTPIIAKRVLETLIKDDAFEVLGVVTKADKPVGRKQIITSSPVKTLANEHGIKIFQPESLKKADSEYEIIKKLKPDYFIVLAYGEILPKKWLEIPEKKPVNIHGSLLPKYRGASPLHETLLHGDSETGITIQEMAEKMDSGDIMSAETIKIEDTETITELFEKATETASKLITETIKRDFENKITPIKQDENDATYCKKITKTDGFVLFEEVSANDLFNKYRAYKDWPGIWTFTENGKIGTNSGKRIKLLEIELGTENDIKCKNGFIKLIKVQIEGGSPITFNEFIKNFS